MSSSGGGLARKPWKSGVSPSRLTVLTLAFIVAMPLVAAPPSSEPAAADPGDAEVQSTKPVASRPLPKATDPARQQETKLPAASWPAAGVAEVELPEAAASASLSPAEGVAPKGAVAPSEAGGRVQAGTLPVFVGRAAQPAGAESRSADSAAASSPSRVRVEVLGRAQTEALNVQGVLVRLDRADGEQTPGAAELVVDYSAFRAAFGAGYGRRLRLVRYPACVLTTPKAAECAKGVEVTTRNDTANRQLIAEVSVEPAAEAAGTAESTPGAAEPSPTPSTSASPSAAPGGGGAATEAGSVFAVTAAAGSGGGSYAAQPLSSQAEWSTSGGAGDFTWSYPLRLPPTPAGAAPELALSYSSGVADGQTAASNNQASWAGLGFDLGSSYIERKYAACAYNGHNTGDLCWKYDNAYLVLNGVATELIRKDADEWYARKDQGWRIRRATGGSLPGRDNDDERWVVTTRDGTQYWFGVSRQPTTNRLTHSVWTAPVYGLKSGDPCWTGTFATSHCEQAWRWNLDYVTDRNGNSMTYFYEEEGNYYGRGNDIYDQAYYIRGGSLISVEYGARAGAENTTPPAKVTFWMVGRCAGGADSCGAATVANAANYPDVPTDQLCTNTLACHNHSPTFFTAKRLNQATTYVRNPADPDGWQGVDSYDFDTTFYGDSNDPVDPALMLTNVIRSGVVGATPITLSPGTWFSYVAMQNRVDVDTANGSPAIVRHRVENIYDDFGSHLGVTYGQPQPCSATALPAPASNATNCFPAWWQPENRPGEIGWFRKYVATKVVNVDRTGLSPAQTSTFGYLGTPAWAHDAKGTLVPPEQQSYGQWRGYSKVLQTDGTSGATSRTENLYFRGLHGSTSVSVTNSRGGSNLDYHFLEGMLWESRSLDAAGVELVGTLTGYFSDITWDGGTKDAWIAIPADASTRTRLSTGAYRYARTHTDFENGTALPLKTTAYGEVNADGSDKPSDDETCTATTYARNESTYRFFPAIVEARSGTGCGSGDTLLSRAETFYDNHANLSDAPTSGRPTKTRAYRTATEYTESTVAYDTYGRATSATDPLGRTTTTAYTPSDNQPTTKVVTTNPKGWTAETTLAPWWGSPTTIEDVNGRVTDLIYDQFGRPTSVWLPGRPKTEPASMQFSYGVGPYEPNWAKTSNLHTIAGDGTATYLDSWTYFDGFGDTLETQTAAPGGTGRVVTAHDYDTRGLPHWTSTPFYNTGEPGSGAVNPLVNDLSRTQHAYDALERETSSGFHPPGTTAKWTTGTSYGGDRTTVTPPVGGTKTSIIDTGGRTTSLVEQTDTGTTTTSYGYNRRGELTTVTDAKGNVTRYTFDLLGQRTKAEDPDAGTTTYAYNDGGQLVSSTDARNKTLVTSYDNLGRKTAIHEGSTSGTKHAEWTYDTLPSGKGLPVSSTAFHSGNAYTSAVAGYDAAGRATGTSVTIPAAEGALAGAFAFGVTYDAAGRVATTSHPQAGGLGAETITSVYNGLGLPATLTGSMNQSSHPYVTATSFTQLGQLAKRTYGGGTAGEARRIYTYETDTQRLSTVVTRSGSGLPNTQDDRYSYDALGNATRVAEHNATGTLSVAECFAYDKLNRLTQASTTTATTCAANPGPGTANGVEPYHLAWTYDDIGNRLTETDKLTSSPVTRTTTYPASGANSVRPHAATQIADGRTSPDSYTYDAAGNTAERHIDGLTAQFAWDAFGRLDHADVQRDSGGTTVTDHTSYVYDADGNRLLRKEPGNTVLYLGGMELRLTTTGPGTGTINATRYYTHGGAPVAVRTVGGLHWILNDGQASAELNINATTGATSRRRYLPFGGDRSATSITSAWPSERGFLNKTKDSATGLSHLGARQYDTVNGRFLTTDPLADPTNQQNSPYAYAANNPVAYSDPSGLSPEDAQFWDNKPASAAKHSRAANTTRYGKPRSYNRPAPRPSGGGGDSSSWQKWFSPAHAKAISLRIEDIHAKYGPNVKVTVKASENYIPGGSSKGNGNAGYADIICWDCETSTIFIWEVKHEGGPAEAAGPAQLGRYIRELQRMVKPGVRVQSGPAFEHSSSGPHPVYPDRTVTVRSSPARGVEVYRISRKQDEPYPVAAPRATPARPAPTSVPAPTAGPEPVAPRIPDGLGVVGFVVVGVVAVAYGIVYVGGVAVGGFVTQW